LIDQATTHDPELSRLEAIERKNALLIKIAAQRDLLSQSLGESAEAVKESNRLVRENMRRQMTGTAPVDPDSRLGLANVLEGGASIERALESVCDNEGSEVVNIWQYLTADKGYGYYGWGTYPTTRSDRQEGRNRPIFYTEADLHLIRGMARVLAAYNDTAKGAFAKLQNYVVGPRGFKPQVSLKRSSRGLIDSETGTKLVNRAQSIIEDFCGENRASEMQRESELRLGRDGESYLTLWHIGEGRCSLRFAEPEQNTQPYNTLHLDNWLGIEPLENGMPRSSWTFGVHCPQDDIAGVHGYYFQWHSADTSWSYIPGGVNPILPPDEGAAAWCEHIKRNTDANVKRGISDLFCSQIAIDLAHKLLLNIGRVGSVQSAIAWIEEYAPGVLQSDVVSSNNLQPGARPSRNNPNETSFRYRSSTILQTNGAKQFKPAPVGEFANEFIAIRDTCLRSAAQVWSMPENMLTGDASNNNFASLLVAGDPFVNECESRQGLHVESWQRLLLRVLWFAWQCGEFGNPDILPWGIIRAVLEITVIPPSVRVRDEDKATARNKTLSDAGILSPQEWSGREELDYDTQQEKRKAVGLPPIAKIVQAGGKPNDDTPPNGGNPPDGQSPPQGPPQGLQGVTGEDPGESIQEAVSNALESLRCVLEAEDASGHEHKGKGPGGGQFVSKGGSGSSKSTPTLDASDHPKDAEGKHLKDAQRHVGGKALPAHIAALKIPPAWTGVKINPDPKGDLLATGYDEKGRRQSIYSDTHATRQAAIKFARISELMEKQKRIAAEISRDMESGDPKTREAATVLALIQSMGLRPGSERDTQAKAQAYGATTLRGSHVIETPDGVRLQFTGKKGVKLDLPVTDPKVASMLRERKQVVGDGRLFSVSDSELRKYAHTLDGGSFKPKDFRTLRGTSLAIDEIKKVGACCKNPKEYKQTVKRVATVVSKALGNTPTVALQSYIDPTVFATWSQST